MTDTPQVLKPNTYRSCVNCGKDIYYDCDGNWLHWHGHTNACSGLRAAPSVSPQVDDERMKEIRERRAKVVSLPWRYVLADNLIEGWFGGLLVDFATPRSIAVSTEERKAHGDFIANAPTDIDYLLSLLAARPDDARVERLRPAPSND